jgi:hypothetical protein
MGFLIMVLKAKVMELARTKCQSSVPINSRMLRIKKEKYVGCSANQETHQEICQNPRFGGASFPEILLHLRLST